jgi:S-adenosyl methyltransferase
VARPGVGIRVCAMSPSMASPGAGGSLWRHRVAGLDLVEPGVVQLHRWRAGTGDPSNGRDLANYGGVGRKP